jgi:hypothetical protein
LTENNSKRPASDMHCEADSIMTRPVEMQRMGNNDKIYANNNEGKEPG